MESHLDLLAKALASNTSRREALRRAGGILGAALLASFGIACESESTAPRGRPALLDLVPPGRCKLGGQNCRENTECCSEFCDPTTGQCLCPAGSVECPSTGACISCSVDQVLNPETCTCECVGGTALCGSVCCSNGKCCSEGVCCENGNCCGTVCCPLTTTCCGGVCTDTSSDRANCGGCGRACTGGFQICSGGMCCNPMTMMCH